MRVVVAASALLLSATPASGQIPIPLPTQRAGQVSDSAQRADTITVPAFRVPPPVPPLGALWRSLLVPGWGQAALHRRVTGAVFVFWEGVTLTMTVKSVHQLHYAQRTDTITVSAKRQEVQDWAVLLGFNHLLAGAEAFVSANLWDFPGELQVRALPGGATGIGVVIPLAGRSSGGR